MSAHLHVRYEARRLNVWLLISGVGLYFFANIQRVAVPGSVFNELQSSFAATAGEVAATGAAFMYIYALAQLIVGVLVDKYGGARVLAAGGTIFVLGALLFPLSANVDWLYASRALVGLGAGSIYLSIAKETDRLFPADFAGMLGLIILFGYSGGVVGTLPLSLATAWLGWRAVFVIIGLLMFLMLLVNLFLYRRVAKPPVLPGRFSLKTLVRPLRGRASLAAITAGSLSFGAFYLMLTVVGKKFLEDFCNMSGGRAAAAVALLAVVSAVMNFFTGNWSRRLGNIRRPFLLASLLLCCGGALLALTGGVLGCRAGWFYVTALTMMAASSGFAPITNALARELNPPECTGGAIGVFNFTAYLSVAVFGNLAGVLMERFGAAGAVHTAGKVIYPEASYLAVFVLTLIASGAALAVGVRVPETRGVNQTGLKNR